MEASQMEKVVADALGQMSVYVNQDIRTEDEIRGTVPVLITLSSAWRSLDARNQELAIDQVIEETLRISRVALEEGASLTAQFEPWIDERWESQEWPHWKAYSDMLARSGRSPKVLSAMRQDVKRILELAGDPELEGEWERRGLVIGDVQSGKTGTYLALLNMAVDAGYRLIVIIGGHTEDLRRQTQARVDEGLHGVNSRGRFQHNGLPVRSEPIGVGKIRPDLEFPAPFTTVDEDFSLSAARKHNLSIEAALKVPAVLVVKKNATVLRNVSNWIASQSSGERTRMPFLVIDDESDYASVDTAKEEDDPTRVNAQIIELLGQSARNCYIGFTATPFANVLMDPEAAQGLFPSDFIYSLEAPSNYYGAARFFDSGESGSIPGIRVSTDMSGAEFSFPFKHRSHFVVPELPDSLHRAIDTFLIAMTIDDLEGRKSQPKSMLINVSRYKNVQRQVHELVADYVNDTHLVIANSVGVQADNTVIRRLRKTWEEQFGELGHSWDEVLALMPESLEDLETELVNGDTVQEREQAILQHRQRGTLDRRRRIAVGGTILSRGVTLDRLLVSYFHQRTQLSDTLLQMGRWFGYRDGYDHLIRVWLDAEVRDWFVFTSNVLDDLRSEVVLMKEHGRTPREFGLKVRRHPEGLKVTAANKMRHSDSVTLDLAFYRARIESTALAADDSTAGENVAAYEHLLSRCWRGAIDQGIGRAQANEHRIFTHVPAQDVTEFLLRFRSGSEDTNFGIATEGRGTFVAEFAQKMKSQFPEWDVAFLSGSGDESVPMPEGLPDLGLKAVIRNNIHPVGDPVSQYLLQNRRLLTESNLRQVVEAAENINGDSLWSTTVGDRSRISKMNEAEISGLMERPVLLLLRIATERKGVQIPDGSRDISVADGLVGAMVGFPGHPDGPEAEFDERSRVEYVVNKVWMSASELSTDVADA